MSIEAAVAVLGILLTVATTTLGLYVKTKIGDSEDRMMILIAQTYMPRELANERFQRMSDRLDNIQGVRPARDT